MAPNLDVLPVKASQDASGKRKLVYLDQSVDDFLPSCSNRPTDCARH